MKYLIIPVVFVGVLAIGAAQGSGGMQGTATVISAATLGQTPSRDHSLRGVVMPSRQVELVAPLEEILLAVDVEETERIRAQQVVARMDDRLQRVVVEAARVRAESNAEIDRATLDVEDATLIQDLVEEARGRGAANEVEWLRSRIRKGQAEAALTAARESKKLAEVNLQLEEERLARYEIRATFDATVVEILSEAGAMLNENENVVVVADLDTLEAHLNLPVDYFSVLEVGQSYMFSAEAPVSCDIQAVLKTISPIIDTASQTFRCVFTIDNPDRKMPAGFIVYLRPPQIL